MFKDHVVLKVIAGKGGDGSSAMRREKFVPRGGPDGGDGGRGGDVIFIAKRNIKTLSDFRHNQKIIAQPGGDGRKRKAHGSRGKDALVKVPCGTMIFRWNETLQKRELLADIANDGDTYCCVRGGKGGLGNVHFTTSIKQAPTTADRGLPGEECSVELELKLIADIGFIGAPNAGKSTLLSVITDAKPRIGSYAFTTLEPQLGVLKLTYLPYTFEQHSGKTLIIADMPGLLDGAHTGKGLGYKFLRHIERTRILVCIVDGSRTLRDIIKEIKMLENELSQYDPVLKTKIFSIVLTKKDRVDLKNTEKNILFLKKKFPHYQINSLSAHTLDNISPWIDTVIHHIETIPKYNPSNTIHTQLTLTATHIDKINGAYKVSGTLPETIVQQTFLDNDDSLQRMLLRFKKEGIMDKIEQAGVEEGDEVHIAGVVFTWGE